MSTLITSNLQTPEGYKSGAVHLIETQTASSSATIDFVLPSGYSKFEIVFADIVPATDNAAFWLRTSTDGGSTFDSGASDYAWHYTFTYAGPAIDTPAGDLADSEIELIYTSSNVASEITSGEVTIYNPSTATTKTALGWSLLGHAPDNTLRDVKGHGARLAAADVDAIRFLFSSGNIASGTFKLYGWVA